MKYFDKNIKILYIVTKGNIYGFKNMLDDSQNSNGNCQNSFKTLEQQ